MEFGLKGMSRVCWGLVADVTGKWAHWNLGFTTHSSYLCLSQLYCTVYWHVISVSQLLMITNIALVLGENVGNCYIAAFQQKYCNCRKHKLIVV